MRKPAVRPAAPRQRLIATFRLLRPAPLRRSVVAATVGFASLAALATAPAAAADLASHRAVYEMKLSTSKRSSGVIAVDGAMTMEIADACEGWEVRQRIQLKFQRDDGEQFVTDSSFTSYEAKDGQAFQFSIRNIQDGEVDEELRGRAELPPDGPGRAEFTQPQQRSFELPPGTLFPTRHLEVLIESARAGETVIEVRVFDGARLDGALRVAAAISKATRLPAGPAPRGDATLLRGQQAWTVRLAFYPAGDSEPQPDYEVSMVMLANGVARALTLDYSDFAIEGRLVQVERLPRPKC